MCCFLNSNALFFSTEMCCFSNQQPANFLNSNVLFFSNSTCCFLKFNLLFSQQQHAVFLNSNMLFFSQATCCFLTDNVLFFNFSQQQCAVFLNCFVLFFLLAHVLEISVLFNFCFIHSCRHSCKSNNDVMMTQIFDFYFKSFSSHLPSYEEDALDTGDPRKNIQMQIYQL